MPFVAELAIVADTTLLIVLKLIAPVAPTPIAVALPLIATATAMPKDSESIREVLDAETVIALSESSSESTTPALVLFVISLIVSDRPSAAATAVF